MEMDQCNLAIHADSIKLAARFLIYKSMEKETPAGDCGDPLACRCREGSRAA